MSSLVCLRLLSSENIFSLSHTKIQNKKKKKHYQTKYYKTQTLKQHGFLLAVYSPPENLIQNMNQRKNRVKRCEQFCHVIHAEDEFIIKIPCTNPLNLVFLFYQVQVSRYLKMQDGKPRASTDSKQAEYHRKWVQISKLPKMHNSYMYEALYCEKIIGCQFIQPQKQPKRLNQ